MAEAKLDEFEQFMSDLGLEGPRDLTSEEILYNHLTSNSGTRFLNILYQIYHSVSLIEIYLCKEKFVNMLLPSISFEGITTKPLTRDRLIMFLLEYYLLMYHPHRFRDVLTFEGKSIPPCDLKKTIELFMKHPEIQKLLAKNFE